MSATYARYAAQPRPSSITPVRVSWAGDPWSLTGICFLNILLSVVTLGIYRFWAQSEYRRRMWQMVRVNGEPLEYTGTGLELFIGYLKVFFFVILPAIVLIATPQLVLGPQHPVSVISIFVLYVVLFVLFLVGLYRAQRYMLTRTRWRGIAFGLEKGAAGYAWLAIWSGFLSGLTLFWLYPWCVTALRRRLTRAIRFGSLPFRFEGSSGPIYGPFALVWLFLPMLGAAGFLTFLLLDPAIKLHGGQAGDPVAVKHYAALFASTLVLVAVPLMILGLNWLEVRKLNTFAKATKVGGLSGSMEAHAGSHLWLIVSNALIVFFSLGILRPVAQARRLKYLVERFAFTGSADLNEVARGYEDARAQGAGMEATFSMEIF